MKFSIIVPVYNSEMFLEACVASVKKQEIYDWELIFVNDGSTDSSEMILNRYAAEDKRIRVIHQQNTGQFFARQAGIEAAEGDYILFLDSDDELEPECLRKLNEVIQRDGPDLVLYTGMIYINGRNTNRPLGYIADVEEQLPSQWLKERLISSNDLNSLWLKVCHRSLFEGDDMDYSDFWGVHCGEDKVRLLYPVTQAKNIRYTPYCLYRYHHRPGSVMHKFNIQSIPQMMAKEMFSAIANYMNRWGMTDQKYCEMLAIYWMKHFLSVYFSLRENCRTPENRKALRGYPWENELDTTMLRFKYIRKLGAKDILKLGIARARL